MHSSLATLNGDGALPRHQIRQQDTFREDKN
jgi:hypothetical protein